MRIGLIIFVALAFVSRSQVDTHFDMKRNLFLSTYQENKTKWVCGMQVSALDSTNRQLHVRFDLAKNWKTIDSLDLVLTLDTTRTYSQRLENGVYQSMKYTSEKNEVAVFIAVPKKHEYTLSNGISGISWQFHFAHAVLPPKWKKHQGNFKVFYEK